MLRHKLCSGFSLLILAIRILLITAEYRGIEVWDSVLAPYAIRSLLAHNQRAGPNSNEAASVFDRRKGPRTAVEAAILSIVEQLEDDANPFVEYWWRNSWSHHKAHRDIDEGQHGEAGTLRLRHPHSAHVLYMRLDPGVLAPTCLLLEEAVDAAMASVPALPGRLLRFKGSLLHGAPKPTLAYLQHHWFGFLTGRASKSKRIVLAFNTWAARPQRHVDDREPSQKMREEFQRVEEVQRNAGMQRHTWAQPRSAWLERGGVLLVRDSNTDSRQVRQLSIPLLRPDATTNGTDFLLAEGVELDAQQALLSTNKWHIFPLQLIHRTQQQLWMSGTSVTQSVVCALLLLLGSWMSGLWGYVGAAEG